MATKRQKDTPSAAAAVVETEPTLPSALVDLGWTLQRGRNNVGWTAQHPAAHPAGEGALTFGTPDEAINAARELEAAATDDRMAGINRAADRLRAARTPTMPDNLAVLGWELMRGLNGIGWKVVHPTAYPDAQDIMIFGSPVAAIWSAYELAKIPIEQRAMDAVHQAVVYGAPAGPLPRSTPVVPDWPDLDEDLRAQLQALGWRVLRSTRTLVGWQHLVEQHGQVATRQRHLIAGLRAIVESTGPTAPADLDPGALGWTLEPGPGGRGWRAIHPVLHAQLLPAIFHDRAEQVVEEIRQLEAAAAAPPTRDDVPPLTWLRALRSGRSPESLRDMLFPTEFPPTIPADLPGWTLMHVGEQWVAVHRESGTASVASVAASIAVSDARRIALEGRMPKLTNDDPSPESSVPFWAHGPLGKAADAAHLWDEVDPYTWRSRCGKYTFAERKPDGDPGGNRCPVCVEREHATAQPPETTPPEVQPMTTETESLPLNHLFARSGPERQEVRRDTIIPGRYQPRKTFDQAALEQLAASIREHGILNPLQVFQNEQGQLELIAGERRLRAAELAGLETVPVDVKAYTLAQIHEISLIDNLQREDLSEVEEGLAYERLISELGVSENKLAQRINKSRGHIQQRRAIAKAAPEVQDALAEGKLSLTQARAIALTAPGDHAVQQEALQQIVRNLKIGMHESEERCREQTVRIAATTHKKALKALGWKVQIDENSYRPPLIWSKTDKPRQWTGAEIISAVQEQRKPTAGAPVATKPDPEDVALMNAWAGQNGVITSTAAPWVACCISADGRRSTTSEFLSADELHARCETIRQQIVAPVADRLQAHGWTLQVRVGQESGWTITHTTGYTLTSWNWSYVQERTTQIEQGQIDTSKPQAATHVSNQLACKICGATEGTTWIGDLRGYYCQPHGLEVQAEQQRLKEQRRDQAVAILEPLATQADVDALRLLLFWLVSGYSEVYGAALGLTEYAAPEPLAAHIQTLDAAAIRQAVAQVLPARMINQYGTSAALGLLIDQPVEQAQEVVNG